jgi:hypothetical protein
MFNPLDNKISIEYSDPTRRLQLNARILNEEKEEKQARSTQEAIDHINHAKKGVLPVTVV